MFTCSRESHKDTDGVRSRGTAVPRNSEIGILLATSSSVEQQMRERHHRVPLGRSVLLLHGEVKQPKAVQLKPASLPD